MNRRGFTFLEMMIVVVILGVLTAVAIPKMGFVFRKGRLRATSREIAATLRHARNIAILRQDGCEVRFDPEQRKYQLLPIHLNAYGEPEQEDRESRREERAKYQPTEETLQIRSMPEDVIFTLIYSTAPLTETDKPRIIFHPDGSATPGTISIQNNELQAMNIDIYRTTGLTVMKAGDPVLPRDAQPLFYLPEKIQYQVAE